MSAVQVLHQRRTETTAPATPSPPRR